MLDKNQDIGKKNEPVLGAHFSIAKGLHQALFRGEKYGCTAVQLFTKNANTWKERFLLPEEIEAFVTARKKTGIRIAASHTSYLINLGSGDPKKLKKSKNALKMEMIRSGKLGIQYVVLHPGFHLDGGKSNSLLRIADSINDILAKVPDPVPMLLLETTSGQGTAVGHRFEDMAKILFYIDAGNQVGVCLDTCHIFTAGYDIRTKSAYDDVVRLFDEIIGLNRLGLIHLNDSARPFASGKDRHDHIGRGEIGETAFRMIMNDKRLQGIPKILETPKTDNTGCDWDKINLALLKNYVT
jgi:deoxyribonuclease IV